MPQDLKYKGFQQFHNTQEKKRNISLIPVMKTIEERLFHSYGLLFPCGR